MTACKVYQDGKLCRETDGKILSRKSKRVLIKFYDVWEDDFVEDWFYKIRKENNGIYESRNYNQYFIGKISL